MAASRDGLLQMVDQIDEKHEEGHKRLRADFREFSEHTDTALQLLKERMLENAAQIAKLDDAVRAAADAPLSAEKVILTPKIVVAMVAFAVTVTGGVWSANYGIRSETQALRSDVRDIITRMEAQRTAYDAAAKLQEVQSTALRTAIDDMKRRQELQQYEIQALKEVILTGKGSVK